MSQIKIYALNQTITQFRPRLSEAIHQALVTSLAYPIEKKFQRFIPMEPENFVYPDDRSDHYVIIEISMFEGRSIKAKQKLIQTIFSNIQNLCDISPQDIEITIFETPKSHWGIRAKNADELELNYDVNV
ncbi:MAG: tautomerase family protein [Acinetobacter haemolyticus]